MSVYESTAVSGVIAPCKGEIHRVQNEVLCDGCISLSNAEGLLKKSILSAKRKSHIPSQRYMASIKLITVFNWLQIVPYPAPLISSKNSGYNFFHKSCCNASIYKCFCSPLLSFPAKTEIQQLIDIRIHLILLHILLCVVHIPRSTLIVSHRLFLSNRLNRHFCLP